MNIPVAIVGPAMSVTSPLTSALVETWVKPKLAEIAKRRKVDRMLWEHSIQTKFAEYLDRAYQRQANMKTLVLDEPVQLDELYQPLTVIAAADNSTVKINSYNQDFIPSRRRVLVTDSAGMGKSTLLRYLFLECVKGNFGTPIFIELRRLTSNKTVLDLVHDDLQSISEEMDRDFIVELLRQGDFIFFLDGYDEISYSIRDDITVQLQDFISKAGKNDFILSSRPDEALASFADFHHFSIKPLSDDEAYQLLEKYDRGAGLADQIISKLKTPHYQDVHEFLSNPLLVSLLYKAYQWENNIPLKKHIFYRQVYDALFHRHDYTKTGAYDRQKHSELDVEQFHSVLRSLGFVTIKTGNVEYSRDEFLPLISKAKQSQADSSFKEADFLLDLVSTVPLFVKEGDFYRWNHKSIQEYFAAQYVCRDAKSLEADILRAMASDNASIQRYFNVLDMCYDMDFNSFRNSIVYDAAKQIVQFWSDSYTAIDRNLIPEDAINDRKSQCLQSTMVIFPSSFLPKKLRSYKAITETDTINVFKKVSEHLFKIGVIQDTTIDFGLKITDDGSMISFPQGKRLNIMNLLARKKSSLFKFSEADTDIEASATPQQATSFNGFCDNAPVVIDDNPASSVNTAANFSLVCDAIRNKQIIDINACHALIAIVEKETSKQAQAEIMQGIN